MASPELGLSLTLPHTDWAYRRVETIQVGDTTIQVPYSGKPSLPALGGYAEGRYPFWASEDRVWTLNGGIGGGFAAGPGHQTISWSAVSNLTYQFPNTYARLLAELGYGGWTVATNDQTTVYHGGLLAVGAALGKKSWPLDFSLKFSGCSDFSNTQTMLMGGVTYFIGGRKLPPLNTNTFIDAHLALQRAQESLDNVRSLWGESLYDRIVLHYGAESPDKALDEFIKATAQYFAWIRDPEKEDKALGLPSTVNEVETINQAAHYAQMVLDRVGYDPALIGAASHFEEELKSMFHRPAQYGLELLFLDYNNSLYSRVIHVGQNVVRQLESNLVDDARKTLQDYASLLSRMAAAVAPSAQPPLKERMSPAQFKEVTLFQRKLDCLIKGEGCNQFVDVDAKLSLPALQKAIEGKNGKGK